MELALRTGSWPDWALRKKVIRQIIRGAATTPEDTAILNAYEPNLRATVSALWADKSIRTLRNSKLNLAALDAAGAEAYLDGLVKSVGIPTRNRAKAMLSKFYAWCIRNGKRRDNPVAGIPMLQERDSGKEIVYLTAKERDQVLEAAEALPDALAVWLACYAGLRRQEVWRAEWEHVNWTSGRLQVGKSKTGFRRSVPLAAALAKRLKKAKRKTGRIVPWPETYWPMCRLEVECIAALRKACKKIPKARIGWTPFRHTFGSLLAQSGVELDKLSAWMGNTPAICRKHYAQFVPRDHRDAEIDLLK